MGEKARVKRDEYWRLRQGYRAAIQALGPTAPDIYGRVREPYGTRRFGLGPPGSAPTRAEDSAFLGIYLPVGAVRQLETISDLRTKLGLASLPPCRLPGCSAPGSHWGFCYIHGDDKRVRRASRAKAARTAGSHTTAEWRSVLRYFEDSCLGCAIKGAMTKDHIDPVALGGSDDISNLQPLCGSCNSRGMFGVGDRRRPRLESPHDPLLAAYHEALSLTQLSTLKYNGKTPRRVAAREAARGRTSEAWNAFRSLARRDAYHPR